MDLLDEFHGSLHCRTVRRVSQASTSTAARLFLATLGVAFVLLGILVAMLVMAVWTRGLEVRSDADAVIELQRSASERVLRVDEHPLKMPQDERVIEAREEDKVEVVE